MAPGGTPVVLNLNGNIVVVAGNGLTVRPSDGKLLGQVKFDKVTDKRGETKPGGFSSTYTVGLVRAMFFMHNMLVGKYLLSDSASPTMPYKQEVLALNRGRRQPQCQYDY